jgi:hypothetical protein
MEILEAKINWMLGWGNDPDLYLLVDRLLFWDDMIFEKKVIDGTLFLFSNNDGDIGFMVRGADLTKPTEGYGGRHFKIKIKNEDDTIENIEFNGAWSSRSSVMNMYFEPHSMECIITNSQEVWDRGYTFTAGHIALDKAKEAIQKFCPNTEIVRHSYSKNDKEVRYIIKRKDIENPCKTCKGFGTYSHPLQNTKKVDVCPHCNGTGTSPST